MAVIFRKNRKKRLEWALENFYVHGKPISFKDYPYLLDIYMDEHEEQVYMKSAQVGISEFAICESLYVSDELSGKVVYFFPTSHHIGTFVQDRVDSAIHGSPYIYRRVYGESKGVKTRGRPKKVDKVTLKKVGDGVCYFRGTNSENDVTSVDGDLIIFDEYDRCNQRNVPKAKKRLLNSNLKWIRTFTTPEYPGGPIDTEYLASDRRRYLIKCERCNERQELKWHDNFVREYKGLEYEGSSFLPYIPRDERFSIKQLEMIAGQNSRDFIRDLEFDISPVCVNCNRIFDRFNEPEWVPEFPGRSVHGWHISRLFSPRTKIADLFSGFIKAQSEITVLEDFYRQELGLPYDGGGAGITKAILELKAQDYDPEVIVLRSEDHYTTAGIDVGTVFNIVVSRTFDREQRIKIFKGIVRDTEDVQSLLDKYNVDIGVVDQEPEGRVARAIRDENLGRIYLCKFGPVNQKFILERNQYGETELYDEEIDNQKKREWLKINHVNYAVLCERTLAIDEATDAILNFNPRSIFPKSYMTDEKWVAQMCALKRKKIVSEQDGTERAVWTPTSADHYRFADIYDFLAQKVFIDLNYGVMGHSTIQKSDVAVSIADIKKRVGDEDYRLIMNLLRKENEPKIVKQSSKIDDVIQITRYD